MAGQVEQITQPKCSNPIAVQDQGTVIGFLETGAGFGPPVRRIDTHGAKIFLIGDKALKISRAVQDDDMDRSTIDKRHALLDREFEINKTAAPLIYKGAVPIVRRVDGALALRGPGQTLEWALVMHLFAAEAELICIAKDRGILDAVHGDAAARQASEAAAIATGSRFVGIWLSSPTPIRAARVASRGPDASDADAVVVARQADADPGVLHWHRIDTDQPLDLVIKAASATPRSPGIMDASTLGGTNVG